MVHLSMQAADELAQEDISAEVIDLRSIRPIDLELVLTSLRKTNRVVVAEEGWKYYGTGQGLAALIYEYGFDYLDAPIGHVTGKDVPMPYSKPLEQAALPTREDIVTAVKAIVPASGKRTRHRGGQQMQTVVMPKLGDTMEEGKILRWLKQEGDDVKKGDALAEIETEKVNIEVESFFAGTLRKILVPAGETPWQ